MEHVPSPSESSGDHSPSGDRTSSAARQVAEPTGTAARSTADDEPSAEVTLPQVFRIQPLAYFAVPMMFIVTVVLAGASLPLLGWTLVLPVLLGFWIWRLRTVVTEDGLEAVGTIATRDIGWAEIDGLQFPRWGSVRAVLINGTKVRLPAITFQDLPRLSAASRGRIPDPYAAAADS